MPFTATIQSINLQNDQFYVAVLFNDSATNWSSTKTYTFDGTTTQAQAVSKITEDGQGLKASLAKNNALQSRVGTVITI